jgi:hypothetical protein
MLIPTTKEKSIDMKIEEFDECGILKKDKTYKEKFTKKLYYC